MDRTRRSFVALASLTAFGCRGRAPAAETTTSSSSRVDRIVETAFRRDGPGVAVAVVRDGRAVHLHGYGMADVATATPITPTTVFDLASLAKQFTGMAILVARERGLLSLDDDIRTYVPELPIFDARRPIRIDDLSRHVSGLPDLRALRRELPDDGELTTPVALAWLARREKLEEPTGSRWRYNNANYFLLARIAERVFRKSYAALLHDEVFVPAGMKNARVLENARGVIPGRATGYAPSGESARWDDGLTGPAGVFASLDDLVSWHRALSDGQIVSREAFARAREPGRLADGRPVTYSLGWDAARQAGRRLDWHDGDWVGASTYIARYSEIGLAVILLSNVSDAPVEDLERRIAEVYL